MEGITFKIEEFIGVIKKEKDGWNKELNLVSWNGQEAKYDIRSWKSDDHSRMNRGICLSPEEMHRVVAMMQGRV